MVVLLLVLFRVSCVCCCLMVRFCFLVWVFGLVLFWVFGWLWLWFSLMLMSCGLVMFWGCCVGV